MICCRKIGAAAATFAVQPVQGPTPTSPAHTAQSSPGCLRACSASVCPNEQATGYPGYRHAAGTFVTSHLAPSPEKHTHPGLLMRGHPLGMKIYSAARLGLQSHSRSARTRAGRARSGGRCGVGWGGVWGGRTCTQRGRGGRKAPQHILVHGACPQPRRRSESAHQRWLARQGARAVSVHCRSGAGPRASRAAAGGAAASPLPLSPGGGARRPGERGERKMGAARLPRTRALSYPARVRRFRVCGACPPQLWGAGRGCVGTRGACVGRVCGGARVRLVFDSPHRKCT